MSALGIVALCVTYASAGLIVACRIATLAAWAFRDKAASEWTLVKQQPAPDGEQWVGGMLLGLGAGVIWPLVLAAMLARGQLFRPPDHVLARQRAERIRELETELGMNR